MKYSTFILLKPDALKRQLKNEILQFFLHRNIEILRDCAICVDTNKILDHYEEVIERIGSDDFKQAVLREFVDETVHIVELGSDRSDIVAWVRDLIGSTDPAVARPDTIRGMYGEDSMADARLGNRMLRNLIHASDSDENVLKECVLWFE